MMLAGSREARARTASGAGRRRAARTAAPSARPAMTPLNGLTIAVPRGALFGGTVDAARRARARHRRAAHQRAQAPVRGRGRDHDAPLGRPHLRRGRRRRPRRHRQGRAARADRPGARRARPPRVRAARPRLRPLHDGAGQQGGRGSRRGSGARGAAPAGGDARRHQVPARGRTAHGADRPPGGDRRGQGLRRARPADRPGGGDRRPHRHRHHPAGEQPDRPRGAVHLHRQADRQPRLPQAQGGRRGGGARPACASCSAAARCPISPAAPEVRLQRIDASAFAELGAEAVAARLRALVPDAASVAEDVRAIIEAVRSEGDAAVPRYTRAFDAPDAPERPLRVTQEELDAAITQLPARARRRPSGRDRQRRPRGRGRGSTPTAPSRSPRASRSCCARSPSPPPPCTSPAAARPTPARS